MALTPKEVRQRTTYSLNVRIEKWEISFCGREGSIALLQRFVHVWYIKDYGGCQHLKLKKRHFVEVIIKRSKPGECLKKIYKKKSYLLGYQNDFEIEVGRRCCVEGYITDLQRHHGGISSERLFDYLWKIYLQN